MHRGGGRARGCDQRGGVVNLKAFFVDALSSALELHVATPDDVLRYITPDVLSIHLPRPLWARLLTACLGAPRVDSQLVVETIGVPNLCEHVPAPIMWACIAAIGRRAIGFDALAAAPSAAVDDSPFVLHDRKPLAAPPPAVIATGTPVATPVVAAPSLPSPTIPDMAAELEAAPVIPSPSAAASAGPSRARTPSAQRFRQNQSPGIGRLAPTGLTNPRRPQAAAVPSPLPSVLGGVRSPPGKTPPPPAEPDNYEVVTELGKDDWKNALAVEDEQLVDWQAAEETLTSDEFTGRKR